MHRSLRVLSAGVALFLLVQNASFAAGANCEQIALGGALSAEELAQKQAAALAVAPKFAAYFAAINSRLLERGYLVDLLELALISEEHLLLMGPPGNAKSMLADLALGGISDSGGKNSYYRIQMTPETTMSETHGPLDFKTLTATGKYERLYDEGMLNSRNVFIDEIFDGRANAMRNVLGLLAERAHAQGPRVVEGKIETVVAATNKYIDDVYKRAERDGDGDSPKALLDRFAFSAFVPREFEDVESNVSIIQNAKKGGAKLPTLTFDELERVRALVGDVEIPRYVAKFLGLLSYKIKGETEAVETGALKAHNDKLRNGEEAPPPYRATKYHSPRTLGKAAGVLKAMVVREWLKSGGTRPLKASLDDVKMLESFFTLGGPSDAFVSEQLERSSKPQERSQLQAILQERQVFRGNFEQLLGEMNAATYKYALTDLQSQLDAPLTRPEREAMAKKLIAMLLDVQNASASDSRQSKLTGESIGRELVRDFIVESLRDLLGENYDAMVATVLREAEETRARAVAEARKIEEERVREARRKERERQLAEEAVARKEAERKARVQAVLEAYTAPGAFETVISEELAHASAFWAVTPDAAQAVVYSPEEKALHVLAGGAARRTFDTSGGPSELAKVLAGELGAVTNVFAPDADSFTILTGGSGWIFNAETGAYVHEFSIAGHQNYRLAKSPNGQTLYALDASMARMVMIDLKTGSRTLLPIKEVVNKEGGMLADDMKTHMNSLAGTTDTFYVAADGSRALIASEGMHHFYSLDLKSGRLTHLGFSAPHANLVPMGVSDDLSRVYGVEMGSTVTEVNINEFTVADLSKSRTLANLNVGSNPLPGAIFEDGSVAIFATSSKGLVAVDLTTGTVLPAALNGVAAVSPWASMMQKLGDGALGYWGHNGNFVLNILKKK